LYLNTLQPIKQINIKPGLIDGNNDAREGAQITFAAGLNSTAELISLFPRSEASQIQFSFG
jgi:hypothetical protein